MANATASAPADKKEKKAPVERDYVVTVEEALNLSDGAKLVAYLTEKYGKGPLQILVKISNAKGTTAKDALKKVAQIRGEDFQGEFGTIAESSIVKTKVSVAPAKPKVTFS